MLNSLYIKNYVLIDSLEINFPTGLVIITGQTGAGKSILLGALSLVLGAKADVGLLANAEDSCVVEAVFNVQNDNIAYNLIYNNDIDWNNGELTIRRVINKSGKSRAFINDNPVANSLLNVLSVRLLDIHSQNQTALLSDKIFQLDILDKFADNNDLLKEYSCNFKELQNKKKELQETKDKLAKLELEKEFNQSLFDKLNDASLQEGELESLEQEQKLLANAEHIKANLCGIEAMLAPEDGTRIDTLLKESIKNLDKIASYTNKAKQLSTRLEEVRLEIVDVLNEIYDLEANVDLNQERLSFVEDRLSDLYSLLKKHNVKSINDLILIKDNLQNMLKVPMDMNDNIISLEKTIHTLEGKVEQLAAQLSARRCSVAPKLAHKVEEVLRFLELEHAAFNVVVNNSTLSINGKNEVEFKFSATGSNLVNVAKCASGGEKSRIMLALKAIMAKFTQMPSMVFDEIDTGVSGSVADKMGELIAKMGEDMQVFAITHLPQVAAKGNAHFVVSKHFDSANKAVTTINCISGNDRVNEVARLLSGASITSAAIANAKELLK